MHIFTIAHIRVALCLLVVLVLITVFKQSGQTKTTSAASTIIVNSISDNANSTDGLCTLREAITAANANTASGVVTGECQPGTDTTADIIDMISLNGTIVLGSALPEIASPMTFAGPGQNKLTVSGNNSFRVFNITSQLGLVSFSSLTVAFGRADSDWGGGILNQQGADVLVTDSTIRQNSAQLGGGIAQRSVSAFTIRNSTITGNSATFGGGCYNSIGSLLIYDSTLNDQVFQTGVGGAIYNGSILYLINSTIHRNIAAGPGGGIFNGPTASAYVAQSTFNFNISEDVGGGIYNEFGGTVRLLNNIISRNGAHNGLDLWGPFVSLGHNLVSDLVGSSGLSLGTNNANGDLTGETSAPLFALLGPLQNNGGITKTQALLPGSLGIDAGDNCAIQSGDCPGGLSLALTTDQRGVSRQINQVVDMGAFESRPFTILFTSGTAQIRRVNELFDPLIVTVSSPAGDPIMGGQVTFVSPASGPSATLGTSTRSNVNIEANGQASFRPTANGIAGGPYEVVARLEGTNNTVTFNLTNLKGETTTVVTSSVNPSDLNQPVTFTAAVSALGSPTGTIQFKIDGANVGTPLTLSSGVAQLTLSSLAVGIHTVTADYTGDANFNASSGTLAGEQTVKPQPSLSINDVSVLEGDAGFKLVVFQISLSAPSNLAVSVQYSTTNGTATSPVDYQATNGSTVFSPGQTIKTFSVTVTGDVDVELDETFTVTLSNPTSAALARAQGTGTIQNDDVAGGFFKFSQPNYTINETAGLVTVTVIRTNNTTQPVSVEYSTSDIGASNNCGMINGIASPRCDFTAASGTLFFAANEVSKTFNVLLNPDSYVEGRELFEVSLANPTNGSVLINPKATVTLTDTAITPPNNLIDDATVFVRQHYHDFLNREPDSSGLTFWANEITSCGVNPTCIEVKRINVSAAFFLSIEFQQTGYFVERAYKASYGAGTGQSTIGGLHELAVPVIRLNEFLTDTQEISRGVVVGSALWQVVLENNKQAFVKAFVQLPRFVSDYPTSLSPMEFVDKLFSNAGVVPSTEERQSAIAEFGSVTTTTDVEARSRTLKRIVENSAFQQKELNSAFVLMQYFGYLRRNPNDPPDANHTGYDFWMSKLNSFNGNFLDAEMVKAFISSIEYRQRFAP